ncbi:DUF4357 domain-containing protein [Algicella marina]|uniref:DUF4357 domain-containing protein n=2 Tax=Algicella marina TaxID=2683284 RepID=A0A6P1T6Q6_9RHOB|nr:DUF4357 domain-containing protein [Algicella marina]
MARGSSIELFFVDGQPDGMVTAEMFNWTGHVLRAPRLQVKDALSRQQSNGSGIYILLDDLAFPTQAYVGEAESISRRIRDHDSKKDWWTVAVICTTSADSLNKAHAKYLEARLLEIANTVKTVSLDNGNVPSRPGLNEAACANMEAFLDNLLMVLPAIRIDIFSDKTQSPAETKSKMRGNESEELFTLFFKKEGINASANLIGGHFVVKEGSDARSSWVGQDAPYRNLRSELEAKGIIVPAGANARFAKSYEFRSPSAASAVIVGRPDNGRMSWRHAETDRTYAEWEADKLSETSDEAVVTPWELEGVK